MYDKNAGYSGRVHGEIKLKNPAPKAKNTLISVSIFSHSLLTVTASIVPKNTVKCAILDCERFMAIKC